MLAISLTQIVFSTLRLIQTYNLCALASESVPRLRSSELKSNVERLCLRQTLLLLHVYARQICPIWLLAQSLRSLCASRLCYGISFTQIKSSFFIKQTKVTKIMILFHKNNFWGCLGSMVFLDFIASFFSAENRAEFYITNDSTTA